MASSNKVIAALAIIVFVVVAVAGRNELILNPINDYLFRTEQAHVMINLFDEDLINEIRGNISTYRDSNVSVLTYDDVFWWVNAYLKYTENLTGIVKHRSTNPVDILEVGVGKCQEFSILFASDCISVGLPVRTVIVIKSDYSDAPHAFNEVKLNGSQVQADSSINPAQFFLNDTPVYGTWYWWLAAGKDYRFIAFDEHGLSQDVIYRYVSK